MFLLLCEVLHAGEIPKPSMSGKTHKTRSCFYVLCSDEVLWDSFLPTFLSGTILTFNTEILPLISFEVWLISLVIIQKLAMDAS